MRATTNSLTRAKATGRCTPQGDMPAIPPPRAHHVYACEITQPFSNALHPNGRDELACGTCWGHGPRKNSGSHIDASLSRQPLVKGERLVRYEVNAVMHRYRRHPCALHANSPHAPLHCNRTARLRLNAASPRRAPAPTARRNKWREHILPNNARRIRSEPPNKLCMSGGIPS